MKKTFFLYPLFLCTMFLITYVYPQDPEWVNYTCGISIRSLAEEGDYIWAGTEGGLVKIDKTTGDQTFYNIANSGLTDNDVGLVAIGGDGNKWISCGCLVKFDGTNWTLYDSLNSGLPSKHIYSIVIDSAENAWIGTYRGLAKFDGTDWTVYNISNSGLPG